ncbi:MAG: tetratricopeptide repeat protein [Ktedonobacteraceae bacterium]|nr:tetratricopeptide repeat protein [Ktedonobacteraceae bacterium]
MNDEDTEDISYIGKQVGNYRITGAINSGAFGRVYKGVHLYLAHRIVAIKVLHLSYLESDKERANFLREAQFLEMLKHDHILPIYDVGVDDQGFPYLVAEFAQNGSLRDRMEENEKLLPLGEVLTILTQVGQGLQYVHEQNIVHRDLKPENILFNGQDEALIADFGIAVFLETTRTKFVNVIGSPLYMAPEQFVGAASTRSDQYALACIAYELLTGQPPFMAKHAVTIGKMHQSKAPQPPSEINPAIPPYMEQAILRALEKDRENRYPDILSFVHALLKAPSTTRRRTSDYWLDEGNRQLNAFHYAEALSAFERAIHGDSDLVSAYEGKGSALYALGRFDEALIAYEEAIQRDPRYLPAYDGAGWALRRLGRYQEALATYDQLLALDASYAPAYSGKGRTLYRLKHYREALLCFERALQLAPDVPQIYEFKADTLYHLQRYEEALEVYEQALTLNPRSAEILDGRAWVLWSLKRPQEALESFEQAIRVRPDAASPYNGKGSLLYELKRYREALAAFKQAIRLNPRLASAHNGVGNVFFAARRYKEALAAYERAVQLQPGVAAFHYNKADTLKQLGRTEEAREEYDLAQNQDRE